MGIVNPPDIFQQRMNDLYHIFDFIRAYIDNILVLRKGDWTYQVQKSELSLIQLKGIVLKCNIEKYFFRKTKMEY